MTADAADPTQVSETPDQSENIPELQREPLMHTEEPPPIPEPVPSFDLRSADPLSFAVLEQARNAVFISHDTRDSFRRSLANMTSEGEEGRRRGLGFWILADYERSANELAKFDSDDTAAYTRARALVALHRLEEAAQIFKRLSDAYPDEPRPRAGWMEARLEIETSKEDVDTVALAQQLGKEVQAAPGGFATSADGHYISARISELRRDWEDALVHYAEGRDVDEDHRQLLIRFGHLAERCGLDEIAIDVYESLMDMPPVDRSVLMNLGVLYEDIGRDADAAACYDTVLHNNPTSERAKLYLDDARAAMNMYYDEDMEKKEDRLNQILRIPITDFELSVRARNCLNKMLINTLGDLVQRTEQELLSYKNFGETSLTEIKEILHSKGLRLGMPREEAVASIEAHASRTSTGDRSDVLNKPILELQLSIRARRTVETLGCLTLGDVTKHSAEELLGMPNFGQTSLQELRTKLAEFGLKLAGE